MTSGSVPEPGKQDATWTSRLIGAAAVIGLVLLFVALNSDKVKVDLLIANTDIRLGWALLLTGALGFLAGLLFPRLRR